MTNSRLILTGVLLLSMSPVDCFGSNQNVVDMSFTDESHGWLAVVEPSPAILKTTDAGQSWKRIAVPGFYRISFFDDAKGLAIQEVSDSKFAVYRTTDGGEHWDTVALVKEASPHTVTAQWASADDAFVIGEGSGGRGWVGQISGGKPLRVRADPPADFATQSTVGIFGDGDGHIWIVGKHLVLHSADDGRTWQNQYENTVPIIDVGMSGSAVPGGRAWLIDDNKIYRTEDYGRHWVQSLNTDEQARMNLESVSFYSANDGCAVGKSAFIFCTSDSGLNWYRAEVFKTFLVGSPEPSKIALFAPGHGWALVAGTLYKTEDAGKTFVEVSIMGSAQHPGTENRALETSVNGPTSLAYDPVHGYLYIVASEQEQLLRLNVKAATIQAVMSRSEDEQANDINHPESVAVDRYGNVFLGEYTGRIGQLDAMTGRWSVLVDAPANNIDQFMPSAMTFDKAGELLVTAYHRILRYRGHGLEPCFGAGYGFSGDGGPAGAATFTFVQGLAVSERGDIYVADQGSCRIRRIDHQTMIISTIAGTGDCVQSGDSGDNGSALLATLRPASLVMDGKHNLFFVDRNRVRRIDANGTITTYAGTGWAGFSGDGGPAEDAKLNHPSGLAVDDQGNLYIAEFVNNRIRRVDAVTHTITTIAGNGLPHRVDLMM